MFHATEKRHILGVHVWRGMASHNAMRVFVYVVFQDACFINWMTQMNQRAISYESVVMIMIYLFKVVGMHEMWLFMYKVSDYMAYMRWF